MCVFFMDELVRARTRTCMYAWLDNAHAETYSHSLIYVLVRSAPIHVVKVPLEQLQCEVRSVCSAAMKTENLRLLHHD